MSYKVITRLERFGHVDCAIRDRMNASHCLDRPANDRSRDDDGGPRAIGYTDVMEV